MDLVIRGGTVVTRHGPRHLDIAVNAGRIARLLAPGAPLAAAQVVEATGLHIFPGLVDAHVHLREPGAPQKETIETGTAAAACGGVTAVLDMPNTLPPVDDPAALTAKTALLPGRAHVDVGFYALLATGEQAALAALAQAGCIGYKVFLGPTTGNLQAPGWGELLAAAQHLAALDLPLVVHAEDRAVIEYWEPLRRQSGITYSDFLAARPAYGEEAATAQACLLARAAGVRVHIAHVALAAAVDTITQAKTAGWPVSAETCPPYLFLTEDDYERAGNNMKVLPPVRSRADQAALWQGLRRKALDVVATDHAPHTAGDKIGSIWTAAAGAPGVETMLPLLLDAAAQGRCSLADIVRWCSYNPARLFRLAGKGEIASGADADLVLVDMAGEWAIDPAQQHSLSPCTPFAGRRGRGRIVAVYLRGNLLVAEGQLTGTAPAGRWLRPATRPTGAQSPPL